jgi:hypothetical protein
MITIIEQDLGFWIGIIAGIFILLHIPSCNLHWAARLKPFSKYLRRYHDETLIVATLFALIHLTLGAIGLITGIWI